MSAPTSARHPLVRPAGDVHCGRLLCSSGLEIISDQRLDFWTARGPQLSGVELRSLRPGRAARLTLRRADDVLPALALEAAALVSQAGLDPWEQDVASMIHRRLAATTLAVRSGGSLAPRVSSSAHPPGVPALSTAREDDADTIPGSPPPRDPMSQFYRERPI